MEMRGAELLRQTFISVDVTQTSLSRAESDHSRVERYLATLVADVAVVSRYNTSAHRVRLCIYRLLPSLAVNM